MRDRCGLPRRAPNAITSIHEWRGRGNLTQRGGSWHGALAGSEGAKEGHLGPQEAGRGRKELPGAFRECGPAHTFDLSPRKPILAPALCNCERKTICVVLSNSPADELSQQQWRDAEDRRSRCNSFRRSHILWSSFAPLPQACPDILRWGQGPSRELGGGLPAEVQFHGGCGGPKTGILGRQSAHQPPSPEPWAGQSNNLWSTISTCEPVP